MEQVSIEGVTTKDLSLVRLVHIFFKFFNTPAPAERQEDEVVAVPDLNVHVPESAELDRGIARSYFAVFDGRELKSSRSRIVGVIRSWHATCRCRRQYFFFYRRTLARSPERGSSPTYCRKPSIDLSMEGHFS